MKAFLAIAALFSVLVLTSFYYILGGPIPHTITWESQNGDAAFSGRYTIASAGSNMSLNELLDNGKPVSGSFPHRQTFWAPRYATIAAELTLEQDTSTYSTLTIRRAGVPCAVSYQYGTTASTLCN